MSKNISLKDLLDTTFTINDKGEMVGEFTIKRINMIGDILTNYYNENEKLNNIIKEVREVIEEKCREESGGIAWYIKNILDKGE